MYHLYGNLIGIHMTVYTFFSKIVNLGANSCFFFHITTRFFLPFLMSVLKYEQKLEPIPLVFTTQGAIVARFITEYTYFKRRFNKKTDGDTRVLLKISCLALYHFFKPICFFCWLDLGKGIRQFRFLFLYTTLL